MLLKSYRKQIVRPECNPGFESVHCIAHLDQDVSKVLPYLNAAWENRNGIEPSYEGAPKPKVIEMLKLLPKTNCKECGETTCMVFTARMAKGVKVPQDCPPLATENKLHLEKYMSQFKFNL